MSDVWLEDEHGQAILSVKLTVCGTPRKGDKIRVKNTLWEVLTIVWSANSCDLVFHPTVIVRPSPDR